MTKTNKIIGLLFAAFGLYVCYYMAELYYLYNYSHILFLFIIPFNFLASNFLLGFTALIAGSLLYFQNKKALVVYYALGAALLVDTLCRYSVYGDDLVGGTELEKALKIILSVFIFIYFNLASVLKVFGISSRKKELIAGIIGGVVGIVLPVILLNSYY